MNAAHSGEMIATYPGARMRPEEDYLPGVPLEEGPVHRIRSFADAAWLMAKDGMRDGGVTQGYDYQYLAAKRFGVKEIPPYLTGVHRIYMFAWGQRHEECPAGLGPGKHKLMTGMVDSFFSKDAVDGAIPAIDEIIGDLLDQLMPGTHGVLDVAELGRLAALRSSAHLIGLTLTPHAEKQIMDVFDGFTLLPTVQGLPAADPAEDALFLDLLNAGGQAGSYIELIRTTPDLTDAEKVAMTRGVLYAGTDTTAATLATQLGFLSLAENGRYAAAIRASRGVVNRSRLIYTYTSETNRTEPSFPQMPLAAWRTIELPSGGNPIPEGHPILIVLPAVNRDPRVAAVEPDRWAPDLPRQMSMGWGKGPHACAGKYLALRVIERGTAAVMDITSKLEVAEWRARSRLVTYLDTADLGYERA